MPKFNVNHFEKLGVTSSLFLFVLGTIEILVTVITDLFVVAPDLLLILFADCDVHVASGVKENFCSL